MFRKMFENDEWLLWMSYLVGLFMTIAALIALSTGRQVDVALVIGPAFIVSLFLAAHLPRLLKQRRDRHAKK